MKRRSPNLIPERVDAIIEMIRAWEGRLTWPALIASIAAKFRASYTRQALFKHDRIRIAYETHRSSPNRLSGNGNLRPASAPLKAALERLQRLERENAELKKREQALLEQFHRWAYHASTRGLTEEFLDRPLPTLNRRGNLAPSRKLPTARST